MVKVGKTNLKKIIDFNDYSSKWWLESYWIDGWLFLKKKEVPAKHSTLLHQLCLFVVHVLNATHMLVTSIRRWGSIGIFFFNIYIPQPLHMAYTATLCIQLAGDISLETKRQPSRDRELSRQDRVQYILRMAGIWRNALSNSGPRCVLSWGCPLQRVTYNKWSLGYGRRRSKVQWTRLKYHPTRFSPCLDWRNFKGKM